MPRGMMPRRPSRSGRQEKVAERATRAKTRLAKPAAPPAKPAQAPKTATPLARKKAIAGKGYNAVAPERVQEILKRLDERYPGVVCALHHSSAWELLVATILSAQCTDVRVNMVTPALFKKYANPQAFAALNPEDLE